MVKKRQEIVQIDPYEGTPKGPCDEIVRLLPRLANMNESTNRAIGDLYKKSNIYDDDGEPHMERIENNDGNKTVLRDVMKQTKNQAKFIKQILSMLEAKKEEYIKERLNTPMNKKELMAFLAEIAENLPTFCAGPDKYPPPLCGAIGHKDSYKLSIGDHCAAYHDDLWILAIVDSIAENGRYVVKDVDESDKQMMTLARRRVIPLPKYKADPRCEYSRHALFPKNAWVLALYPQTTVFYKGIVTDFPKSPGTPYKIAFDDKTFEGGFSPSLHVQQRYVVAFRDIAYKPREKSVDGKKKLTDEEKAERKKERNKKKKEKKKEMKKRRKESDGQEEEEKNDDEEGKGGEEEEEFEEEVL